MRIGIAGFMHESCTFNPTKTDSTAFLQQSYVTGEQMVEEWSDAHHEVGGFFQTVNDNGIEAVPLLMAWATPSGPVTAEIFDEITSKIADLAERAQLDGLLLAQHGAMVAESHLDADGEILARLRQRLGNQLPIVITLDFHGNVSERVIEHSTAAVAYQTCPHVDQRECGQKAAALLIRHLRGEIKLTQAMAKPPFIVNIMKHDTSLDPLKSHLANARKMEETEHILNVSLMAGFAYADVPQMGPSLIVVTDDDVTIAQEQADALSELLWQDRESFHIEFLDADEAVAMALKSERTPVVLVDTGDNVGGGSAADGTVILSELLRQQATKSVVCLFAPDEVQGCIKAGVGEKVTLTVGGKVDHLHGEPITIDGKIRLIHDGEYIEDEVRHGGKRHNHMGLTALIEIEGQNLLVLNTLRHPPFSLGQLTCLGIQPEKQRILVVKAAIAYKAAYLPIAGSIIEVSTPGLTTVDPHKLNYQHIRRPLYPLS